MVVGLAEILLFKVRHKEIIREGVVLRLEVFLVLMVIKVPMQNLAVVVVGQVPKKVL